MSRCNRFRPRTSVGFVNATPMESLRFRDFVALKSGRDQFSRLDGAALRARLTPEQVAEIEAAIDAESERYREIAARWVLRGLELSRAIRKAKTDAEVTDNAIGAKVAHKYVWGVSPFDARERQPEELRQASAGDAGTITFTTPDGRPVLQVRR